MILLEHHNRILLETLKEAIASEKHYVIDILFSDFDGVKFHVFSDPSSNALLNISISWPIIETIMKQGGTENLKANYAKFLQGTPESGYDVTLQLNLDQVGPQEKGRLPFHLAMLKRNIFAAPFQKYFSAAEQKASPPTLELQYRQGEALYLKTENDLCIVIFQLRFIDQDDQILGKIFIAEFVHAQKSISAAPSVSFSLEEPPRELEGLPGLRTDGTQGFVSFALQPRHLKKRAATINNMQIFRNYLHYHIKCSKAFMHTRMRRLVSSLLQVLNRAKTEPLVVVKRTFSGKTFKRR